MPGTTLPPAATGLRLHARESSVSPPNPARAYSMRRPAVARSPRARNPLRARNRAWVWRRRNIPVCDHAFASARKAVLLSTSSAYVPCALTRPRSRT